MTANNTTLADFYDGWGTWNAILVDAISNLSDEQLAMRTAPHMWTAWQIVGHLAGARAWWFHLMKEHDSDVDALLGEAVTGGLGWEDEEDRARSADELVQALETTWRMIERRLERWTPEMMDDQFTREHGGKTQTFTRQWVLWRLISHDVHYGGEAAAILGVSGLGELDFWPQPVTR